MWNDPYAVTLTYVSEGVYTIKTQQNNGGEKQYVTSGTDPYVDGNAANMTFTEVDAVNHYYTINNGDGNLYATEQTEDGAVLYKVMAGDVSTDYAKWQVVSRAELVAALDAASSSNPVDATFFIKDAGIDAKSVNAGNWTKTNVDLAGGGNAGHSAESWNKSNFELSQTVTGLPNGKYRVTCHGYYRWNGAGGGNNNSGAITAHANGTEVLNAILFAGTRETPLMSVAGDAEATTFCESMSWADNTPNSQWQAAACFTKGYYLNTLNDVVVTDGTLEIGVRKTTQAGTDWAVFDEFKLYYLGEDISIYETPLADAKAAASGVNQSAPMNATVLSNLQSAISTYGSKEFAAYTTVSEITTAISALNTAASNANASIDEYTIISNYLTDAKAKFDGDYSAIETAIASGSYTNSTDGMAAVKARRSVVATTGMAANKDLTGLIDNNSFETGNTNFWTTTASSDTGARDKNTGSYNMTNVDGTYVFNTWWKGTPITQNIGNLPAGAYELKGVVASDGGTVYITMNDKHEASVETVEAPGVGIEFSYVFTLDSEQEVTIGVVGGDNGTAGAHKAYRDDGYWFYKVDNFRLKYIGATAPENTIDGTYYLSIGENYISRGGDSGTEAAMKAEANRLPVQIVTDKAGISKIKMVDTGNYLFYSTDKVYTDGTIPTPAQKYHKPYWKVTSVAGGYQILNTESGKYLTTVEVDRDGETLVATCSNTPATWTFTKSTAANMTITSAKYATFIAPFDVAIPDGVTASKVLAAEDKTLTLTPVETTIPANTPVVLYKNVTGDDFTQDFYGINTASEDTYTVGLLTGNLGDEIDAPVGSYVLQNQSDVVAFYNVTSGNQPKVGKNRAYVNAGAFGAGIKAFFFDEDETTAIEGLDALTSGEYDAIYNAAGIHVEALQKGLNIVVKDGKSYKIYVK